MGLGVLDDRHLEHVPGTATLEDLDELAVGAARERAGRAEVKRSKDGIILVPLPSDDAEGESRISTLSVMGSQRCGGNHDADRWTLQTR